MHNLLYKIKITMLGCKMVRTVRNVSAVYGNILAKCTESTMFIKKKIHKKLQREKCSKLTFQIFLQKLVSLWKRKMQLLHRLLRGPSTK